jgi:hypothetical protein
MEMSLVTFVICVKVLRKIMKKLPPPPDTWSCLAFNCHIQVLVDESFTLMVQLGLKLAESVLIVESWFITFVGSLCVAQVAHIVKS